MGIPKESSSRAVGIRDRHSRPPPLLKGSQDSKPVSSVGDLISLHELLGRIRMRRTFSVAPMSVHGARCGSMARSHWLLSSHSSRSDMSARSPLFEANPGRLNGRDRRESEVGISVARLLLGLIVRLAECPVSSAGSSVGMTALGHFRRSTRLPLWSREPQRPDVRSLLRHVGVAPKATVRVAPASSGKRSTNTSLRSKAWNTAMPGSRLG